MGIILGGPNARFQRTIGPFCIAYQYVNDEPAMAVWPARSSPGTGAFIISMERAWLYADSKTGEPTPYCMEQCAHGLRTMGMFITAFDLRRLMDVVVEGLPDLVRMKPSPSEVGDEQAKRPVIGEMELLVGGKRVGGAEVTAPTTDDLARFEKADG